MTINHNLFIGVIVSLLVTSTLLAIRRSLNRKPQADWNRDQWLRLLSGVNRDK